MKFMWNKKDGGPLSRVFMYGIESKTAGSVLMLRFEHGSREAYHSHAFNAWSLLLRGRLVERFIGAKLPLVHEAVSVIKTAREHCHKVSSFGRSWVFTLRGPWADTWTEYVDGNEITLTHGRAVVS